MPGTTSLKAAGKVATPPPQSEFDKLALRNCCRTESGFFRRLHVLNPGTKGPWPAVYFSTSGATRFDPPGGVGTMCMGQTLGGAMMEKYDDSWGALGDPSRSVTEGQLKATWETVIYLPPLTLFDCSGRNNLTFIGVDAQLYTGEYAGTQAWALRMMAHPDMIDGIWFPSRHDPSRQNIALFQRTASHSDPTLTAATLSSWRISPAHTGGLVYGLKQALATHPEINATLAELKVSRIP
jgi:hypothetical protein